MSRKFIDEWKYFRQLENGDIFFKLKVLLDWKIFRINLVCCKISFTRFSHTAISKMFQWKSKFYQFITKVIIEYREKNGVDRFAIMKYFIKLKNSVGSDKLTLNEISAQLIFHIAGHEITATALTFCFYELSSNLDLQEKARDHIREILEKYDGKVTYQCLKSEFDW